MLLAGLILPQEAFQKALEGAVRTLMTADLAMAFQQWYECYKKC
jgi:hypothetical protein